MKGSEGHRRQGGAERGELEGVWRDVMDQGTSVQEETFTTPRCDCAGKGWVG